MPDRKVKKRDAYDRSQEAYARLAKASEKLKATHPESATDAALADYNAAEKVWQATHRDFIDAMRDYLNLS